MQAHGEHAAGSLLACVQEAAEVEGRADIADGKHFVDEVGSYIEAVEDEIGKYIKEVRKMESLLGAFYKYVPHPT